MNNLFLSLYVKLQTLMAREEGQDLVEYALLVCLIALVCIAGVKQCRHGGQLCVQQHQLLAGIVTQREYPEPQPLLREGAQPARCRTRLLALRTTARKRAANNRARRTT